jgi:hypothetical protein
LPTRLGCCLQAWSGSDGSSRLSAIGLKAGAPVHREAVWLFAPSLAW